MREDYSNTSKIGKRRSRKASTGWITQPDDLMGLFFFLNGGSPISISSTEISNVYKSFKARFQEAKGGEKGRRGGRTAQPDSGETVSKENPGFPGWVLLTRNDHTPSPRAPYAKLGLHLIQTKPCQSIWPINWQGNNKRSNSRVYRLDFRIILTQRIGKALPIQKTTSDRV